MPDFEISSIRQMLYSRLFYRLVVFVFSKSSLHIQSPAHTGNYGEMMQSELALLRFVSSRWPRAVDEYNLLCATTSCTNRGCSADQLLLPSRLRRLCAMCEWRNNRVAAPSRSPSKKNLGHCACKGHWASSSAWQFVTKCKRQGRRSPCRYDTASSMMAVVVVDQVHCRRSSG